MLNVSVMNVTKDYKIYPQPGKTFRQVFNLKRRRFYDLARALEDVSFDVHQGECFGIIGDNGSGKSTLLKIMAGTLYPTSGSVRINGAVSSMLDVTSGFNFDFSGRENIYTKCALLGMSLDQIDENLESILAFSELTDRINHPIRTYSMGMVMRLGFSIAVHMPFEILIVDEVLSVGDYLFQRKCINAIRHFIDSGKTIIITSHSLADVSGFCNRLLLLEHGKVAMLGDTDKVIQAYVEDCECRYAKIEAPIVEDKVLASCTERVGNVTILGVKFHNGIGQETMEINTGDALKIHLRFHTDEPIVNPCIRAQFFRNDGLLVLGTNTYRQNIDLGPMQGTYDVEILFPEFQLLEGDYYVNVGVWPDEWKSYAAKTPYDLHEYRYTISIHSKRSDGGGLARANGQWSLKKIPETP